PRVDVVCFCAFFHADDGIRDRIVTGVQTCALPISRNTEGGGDTFFLQHIHCRVNGSHFCHFIPTSIYWKIFPTFKFCQKNPLRRAGCDRHYGCAFSPNAVLISRAVSLTSSP